MKLEEAFKKYSDKDNLRRVSFKNKFKNVASDVVDDFLKSGGGTHRIKWLKELKILASQETIDFGFIIPIHMINDANADDWEIIE